MNLSDQLKILAKGINPDTGELLDEQSVANTTDAVRLLFQLAEELADFEKPKIGKKKLTDEERIARNISEGRPAKSHFPWTDEERTELAKKYAENADMKVLADYFQRSKLAIATQLERAGLINEDEVEQFK